MLAINIDGTIKTFSKLPKTWGNILNYDKADPQIHFEDGFREVITPQVTELQKLGSIEYDAVNDVFTYPLIDKSATELEQEAANVKQVEKEKIKEKYLKKLTEDQIAFSEDKLTYFPEWKAGTYAKAEKVIFKGKLFENGVEGNTNAPDKGGWTEIK